MAEIISDVLGNILIRPFKYNENYTYQKGETCFADGGLVYKCLRNNIKGHSPIDLDADFYWVNLPSTTVLGQEAKGFDNTDCLMLKYVTNTDDKKIKIVRRVVYVDKFGKQHIVSKKLVEIDPDVGSDEKATIACAPLEVEEYKKFTTMLKDDTVKFKLEMWFALSKLNVTLAQNTVPESDYYWKLSVDSKGHLKFAVRKTDTVDQITWDNISFHYITKDYPDFLNYQKSYSGTTQKTKMYNEKMFSDSPQYINENIAYQSKYWYHLILESGTKNNSKYGITLTLNDTKYEVQDIQMT